jgi:dethiobiotin synthetase
LLLGSLLRERMPGYFITATDTDVGKTWVTAALARTLVAAGQRVGVYKPVASGCMLNPCGQTLSDDAQALWEAAGRPLTLHDVCPQRFLAPLAPPLAAAEEGIAINEELLVQGLQSWREASDVVLVEGAGGLLSPLSANWNSLDLARAMNLPLLIVAANRVGVMHQVLALLHAARALAPDVAIAGIVLNHPRPRDERRDPSQRSNLAELQKVLGKQGWEVPLYELEHGEEVLHLDD